MKPQVTPWFQEKNIYEFYVSLNMEHVLYSLRELGIEVLNVKRSPITGNRIKMAIYDSELPFVEELTDGPVA